MAQHDIGDAVRLWAVFRDESGDQAAPTTVTLIVTHPDGTDESVATSAASSGADVTNAAAAIGQTLADETGLYKASVTPDEAGFWQYEWTGAGAIVEVQAGWFEVPRRRVDDPA